MDKVQVFREYTRQLECHLESINKNDCCCCSISTAQCFAIVEIGRRPGISLKELALILHADKSSVSRTVEELVKGEFVKRETAENDRRKITLQLLPKGQARFEKIENDMYLKFQQILSAVPEEKQESLIEALQLFVTACEKVGENNNDNDDR